MQLQYAIFAGHIQQCALLHISLHIPCARLIHTVSYLGAHRLITHHLVQVRGFVDRVAANNFMMLNPNRVTAAVHLEVTSAEAVGFTLQTNSTVISCDGPHTVQRLLSCITKLCHLSAPLCTARMTLQYTTVLLSTAQVLQGEVPGQPDHV